MKFLLFLSLCVLLSCGTATTDVLVDCDNQKITRQELRLLYQATHIKNDRKNLFTGTQAKHAKDIALNKIIFSIEKKEDLVSSSEEKKLLKVAQTSVLKDLFIDNFTKQQEQNKIPFYLIQFLFIKNGPKARKKAEEHLVQLILMKQATDKEVDLYIAKNSEHSASRVTGGRVPWFYTDDAQNPYRDLLAKVKLLPKKKWSKQLIQTSKGFYAVRLLKRKDINIEFRAVIFMDYYNKTIKTAKYIAKKIPRLRKQALTYAKIDPYKKSMKHSQYIATSYTLHKLISFNNKLLSRQGTRLKKGTINTKDKDMAVLTFNNKKITVQHIINYLTYNPLLHDTFTDKKGNINPFFLQFACLSYLLADEAVLAGFLESPSYKKRLKLEYARVISQAYLEKKKPKKASKLFMHREKEKYWKAHSCSVRTSKLEDGAI